ncbi:CLUMA_CG019871, isoform A [Clunio marinus]|uniref:CLUMA_CG019871, isoform A n=1 Tax=Clunio marinus TaxID=568069 RepID=A0A1J1J273_9DIPT|nr:CLUMA_CG019871, isoform A [Clunio marinus]
MNGRLLFCCAMTLHSVQQFITTLRDFAGIYEMESIKFYDTCLKTLKAMKVCQNALDINYKLYHEKHSKIQTNKSNCI